MQILNAVGWISSIQNYEIDRWHPPKLIRD